MLTPSIVVPMSRTIKVVEDNKKYIYFDHAATTNPLKEVGPLYNQVIDTYFANAASSHKLGSDNARLLEGARKEILASFGLRDDYQVIFTSGATEANNLALKGFMERYKARGKHLIISAIEHPSIMNTANRLTKEGYEVSFVPVDQNGKIQIDALRREIKPTTVLVSIMGVNNEVGSIQPIKEVLAFIKQFPNIKLHVDAVQAVGKVTLPYKDIDMFTVSLHKIGGLKGTGILIKRKNIDLIPMIDGGGHEYGFRSGTNDLAGAIIANMVIKKALANVTDNRIKVYELVKPLYDYFKTKKDEVVINSSIENPYIVNISFVHKKASVFAEYLSNNNIMVSTHSACSSKLDTGSPTLTAMGRNTVLSHNSMRLSFSTNNTVQEINRFIEVFEYGLKRLRG